MAAPLVGNNLLCSTPLAVAIIGPVAAAASPTAGLVLLLAGFLAGGQALAISGRVLDHRFCGLAPPKGAFLRSWREGWSEGLLMGAILLAFFSLAFSSVPYYWNQNSVFGAFSLLTLGIGTLLIMGALPFYLPVRRREGKPLFGSFVRSFRIMNAHPGLSLVGAGLGLAALLATVLSLGLFPGLAGLATLHQGVYDLAMEKDDEDKNLSQ